VIVTGILKSFCNGVRKMPQNSPKRAKNDWKKSKKREKVSIMDKMEAFFAGMQWD
jgi:hypothetical protein|tara:strand:+ start:7486 stop:7650 length:165 start_codon:yes stop_codon:yes gene_type:complete